MRNRVPTCVALLLLLGAAMDLLVPGLCSVEEAPPSHEHAVMTASHPDLASSPDVGTWSGDDCFCCCAHVVPRRFARVLPAVASLELTSRLLPALVDGPPDGAFRPPRG